MLFIHMEQVNINLYGLVNGNLYIWMRPDFGTTTTIYIVVT
jgi:hypothetical protein